MTTYPYIIDSHCHLNYKGLKENLEEVFLNAKAANVGGMLAINTKMAEFDEVLAIANSRPNVWATVGIHPHEAEKEAADIKKLIAGASHAKVVGIGETGLDYFYDNAPKAAQISNFKVHIEASAATGLPLIIHSREAEKDTYELLKERAGEITGVMHCFTASPDLAEKSISLGLYVSFSGILTFKNAENVRAAAMLVPDDRILVETDSPYLAPIPHRGKPCQPAYVADTLKYLAEMKDKSVEEMTKITTRNFFELFQKAEAQE